MCVVCGRSRDASRSASEGSNWSQKGRGHSLFLVFSAVYCSEVLFRESSRVREFESSRESKGICGSQEPSSNSPREIRGSSRVIRSGAQANLESNSCCSGVASCRGSSASPLRTRS
jgi:hypothetical protein